MLAVVRQPGIARLGAAGLLTEVGDWILLIALPLFVLQVSGSPFVTATVFALGLVPTVVASPLAGTLIDRFDPWRLMSTVAVLQAVFLLPLLSVESADDLWVVYMVVVVESVLGTIIEPCRIATAALLVPTGELMAVNHLMGVLSSIARLVGGPLGGLVLGLGGIDSVVVANVVTFLAAAALLGHGISRPVDNARPTSSAPRIRLLHDWVEGLTVVTRTPMLRRVMGVVACASLAQGAFVVFFVLFVLRDLHGSEADVGILRGVQAIGALAGGALLALVVRRLEAGRLIAISLLAFGVLSLTIWNAPALTVAFSLYVGLFIAAGLPGLAMTTGLLTLLQTHSTGETRGRVLSTFFAVLGGVQALGMLGAGLVGTGTGLTIALQVQGALYLVAAALALRLTASSTAQSAIGAPPNPISLPSGSR